MSDIFVTRQSDSQETQGNLLSFIQQHFVVDAQDSKHKSILLKFAATPPLATQEEIARYENTGETSESMASAVNYLAEFLRQSHIQTLQAVAFTPEGLIIAFSDKEGYEAGVDILTAVCGITSAADPNIPALKSKKASPAFSAANSLSAAEVFVSENFDRFRTNPGDPNAIELHVKGNRYPYLLEENVEAKDSTVRKTSVMLGDVLKEVGIKNVKLHFAAGHVTMRMGAQFEVEKAIARFQEIGLMHSRETLRLEGEYPDEEDPSTERLEVMQKDYMLMPLSGHEYQLRPRMPHRMLPQQVMDDAAFLRHELSDYGIMPVLLEPTAHKSITIRLQEGLPKEYYKKVGEVMTQILEPVSLVRGLAS